MLAGHDVATVLDALVFSGYALPMERVMVNGIWQVIDGRHINREQSRSRYQQTANDLSRLLSEST